MATIRKRGPYQWQAIIKRKGYPNIVKTFETRKDAELWSRGVEREMDLGTYAPPADVQMSDLIDRYRATVLPTLRGHHHASVLRRLADAFGGQSLSAVTPAMVATYRDARLRVAAASTVRKEISVLSRIIELASREWGYAVPVNPCRVISRPPERNARDRRLRPDEERYLLAACPPHLALLARLALATAARLGELLAVRWPDVDRDRRVMIVRGVDGRGTKNGDPLRAIPLSSSALQVLDEAWDVRDDADDRVMHWWRRSDSVTHTWRRAVDRARQAYLADCARDGVTPDSEFLADLHFHDLRHEAISRLVESGALSVLEVAGVAGHKTLHMLKRYTHLRAEELALKLG